MSHCTLKLEDAIELLKEHQIFEQMIGEVNPQLTFEQVSYDSKEISANTLFFCKGANFKTEYLTSAIQAGATAYLSEVVYEVTDVPAIIVSDIRKAMAVLAMAYYDYPQNKLKITAYTGTKGKTSSVYFLKHILDKQNNGRTALFSTIATYTGGEYEKSVLTTPEALELYRNMHQAVENGLTDLVMEVSSQSYKTNRVYGLTFDTGIFLNISEDHISPIEHPDFEDYLTCKLQLVKNSRLAVINAETREFDRIYQTARDHAERVVLFGNATNHATKDYYFDHLVNHDGVLSFEIAGDTVENQTGPNINGSYEMNMLGAFNVENALSAMIAAKEYGCDREICAQGIAETSIPGRMNLMKVNDITIVIDYAHNYVSMYNLLTTIKQDFPTGKKIVLFGSTGEKGISRRKDLGRVSGEFADQIIITEDDPQGEDPMKICLEIASYVESFDTPYEIILNRSKGIEQALASAEPGDVVVLAGKGADAYQKRNGVDEYYETDMGAVKRIYNLK